jgi:hypothetical protein
MAQGVELLPSKHKAPSSIPSTTKKKSAETRYGGSYCNPSTWGAEDFEFPASLE